MNKNHILLVFTVVLFSCSDANKQGTTNNNCDLEKFSFQYGNNSREYTVHNADGKPVAVTTVIDGKKYEDTMKYTYGDNGKLTAVSQGKSSATYVYDGDKLLEVICEGQLRSSKFENNESGQIIKQTFMYNGKPHVIFEYEYNEEGAPYKYTVIDAKGEKAKEIELTYDDKINPFKNMGPFVNNFEVIMGYPIGNYEHNVVKIITTYLKKSSFKINGKYKNSGDIEGSTIELTYNENGCPTEIIYSKGSSYTLSYSSDKKNSNGFDLFKENDSDLPVINNKEEEIEGEITRKEDSINEEILGTWTSGGMDIDIDTAKITYHYHGQCVYYYKTNFITQDKVELIWGNKMDCKVDIKVFEKFGLDSVPEFGKPFAKFHLKDSLLHVEYYYPKWVDSYRKNVTSLPFPDTFYRRKISISQIGSSQLKELNPTTTRHLDLSVAGEREFNDNLEDSKKIRDKMSNGVKYEDLSEQEKNTLSKVDETVEDYWDIIGGGCSWYCGGGPKEVTASSSLKSQGAYSYEPKHAHDLNYKTAWVEGVKGYGIGEYLLYKFDGASPRINEIIVVNGYVKSKTAWENNSRVKKLKVYIDNKPYAILNLKDIRGSQGFKVEPIGSSDRKDRDALKKQPDWTLKFEILDVYEGLKYDDVVISEIYFDGLDVHCFAKGTKIQLPDNSTQNVEDLKVGDLVAYMDFDTKTIKSTRIEKTEKVIHHVLVSYQFESGLTITATQDHPFKIDKKGWSSLKPDKSKQYVGYENISKIKIGDLFLTANGTEKLVSIDFLEGEQETYTISKLSSGDNFIANGLIVGVEELKD